MTTGVVETGATARSGANVDILGFVAEDPIRLELELDMTVGRPSAGSILRSTAVGLAPGSSAVLEVRSSPRELDRRVVDASGGAVFDTRLPGDIEPGVHRLILSGRSPDGTDVFSTAAFEIDAEGVVVAVVDGGGTTGSPASESMMSRALAAGRAVYDPSANVGAALSLGLAAGVVLVVASGGRRPEDESGEDDGSTDSESSDRDEHAKGDIGGIETKAIAKDLDETEARGDAGWMWRIPGESTWRRTLVAIVNGSGRWSTAVPRIAIDGHWLRAMFGGLDPAVVAASFLVGGLAGVAGGGAVPLPTPQIVVVLVCLSTFDAFAGLAAFVSFASMFVARGGIPDFFEIRTLLGVLVLLVCPALMAHSIRPIRRPRPRDPKSRLDRLADYVMMPIFVAYGTAAVYAASNGLSGLELVSASDVELVKYACLCAVLVRLIGEDVAIRLFPRRLGDTLIVNTTTLDSRVPYANVVVKAGLYLIGAGTFFGLGPMTWLIVVLMSIVPLAKTKTARLPNLAVLHRWFPRGLLRSAVMVFVGAWFAEFIASRFVGADVRTSAVLLLAPSIVIGVVDLFAREGGAWPDTYVKRFGGAIAWFVTFAALVGWLRP